MLSPLDVASGLVLMWCLFGIFALGFSIHKNKYQLDSKIVENSDSLENFPLSILSLISVAASIYSTYFYTGKGIQEVVLSIVSSLSLYNDYQAFFEDQALGSFSLSKLPAIFSSFALKSILIYSTIFMFSSNNKRSKLDKLWYSLILISYLFFSLARGTSFELFEILVLIWFCVKIKFFINQKKSKIISANKIFMLLIALASISLYNYNIQARYSFSDDIGCPTAQLCMATNSLILHISAPIAQLSNKLSGYFTFGILFSSVFITDIWMSSFGSFVTYLFPSAFTSSNDIQVQICDIFLDCGAAWKPDVLKIIQNVGFLGLVFLIFTLGLFCRKLMAMILREPDFIKITLIFFIFLSMISIPIGNFVTASSSNIILLTLVVIIFVVKNIKFRTY